MSGKIRSHVIKHLKLNTFELCLRPKSRQLVVGFAFVQFNDITSIQLQKFHVPVVYFLLVCCVQAESFVVINCSLWFYSFLSFVASSSAYKNDQVDRMRKVVCWFSGEH